MQSVERPRAPGLHAHEQRSPHGFQPSLHQTHQDPSGFVPTEQGSCDGAVQKIVPAATDPPACPRFSDTPAVHSACARYAEHTSRDRGHDDAPRVPAKALVAHLPTLRVGFSSQPIAALFCDLGGNRSLSRRPGSFLAVARTMLIFRRFPMCRGPAHAGPVDASYAST